MIFENIIIIQTYDKVFIFNSLKLINNIVLEEVYGYMYKYDEQYILAVSKYEENNTIAIYKIENTDLIEYGKIKVNLSFKKINGFNHYPVTKYNNKFLLTLKNKKVFITCHNKIYLLK